MSHYDYLEKYWFDFLKRLGGNPDWCRGIIVAHGDKFYGYRGTFERAGIHFYHGVAIGLLSCLKPWSEECRETSGGWVPVEQWVVKNSHRFLSLLPPPEVRKEGGHGFE